MRILILTSDFPPRPWSGIGVAVASQARALAERGVEVHVVVAGDRRQSPLRTGAPVPGLTVHALGRGRFPLDPREFDWLHLHSLRLAELAFELRRRFALRLVYTAHGFPDLEIGRSDAGLYWSALQRRLMRACERVVFLSRAEFEHGLARSPGLGARACVVPNGVSPAPAYRPREPHGPLVFAGRFTEAKGVGLFAAVARRIGPLHRPGIVAAGGHGDRPGTAALARLATRSDAHCTVTGWLDRTALDALYARAAAVLVPSRYEPFGLVALEAMRMGAPVIVSDTGGLADIVADRAGGWRIGTRHPDDWSHAVHTLLGCPATTRQLSQRGRRHASTRFDIRAVAARLLAEVYTA